MTHAYALPRMTALVAFEAAARHNSFRKAALEINVTAAAVSHQVKALEADLGCSLFRRLPRGVELTEKGELLSEALRQGFSRIAEVIAHLRDQPDQVDVTIATSTAISALWLTPRIAAFWRFHPDISVSQIVSDVPAVGTRTDLDIYYGDTRSAAGEDRELFRDRILALGSPGFAMEHGIKGLSDLLRVPLIHSSVEDVDWTTWDDWLAALGQQAPAGRRFRVNNYMIGLMAAEDGVGAVLGWEGLVGGLLEEKRLVKLLPDYMPSPSPFSLRIHAQASARSRLFADWLTSGA